MTEEFPSSFLDDFRKAASQVGWVSGLTPGTAVQRWRYFADDCQAGYPFEVEYYFNDLTIRSALADVLIYVEQQHPESSGLLASQVADVDAALKPILSRESFPRFPLEKWWLRNSPRYAARDFCRAFKRAYGVDVDAWSRFDENVDAMQRLSQGGHARSEICVRVRMEDWYVVNRPDLFLHACTNVFTLGRSERRAIWYWMHGQLSDESLASRLICNEEG